MRLAAHLRKTHEELLDQMTVEEFHRWLMLEQIEPYGEYGAWLRTGLICSTMANIHRDKNQPAFTLHDFMPEAFHPRKKPDTPQSMKDKWMAIMHAQNAVMARKTAAQC